jgi:hypothetical protein
MMRRPLVFAVALFLLTAAAGRTQKLADPPGYVSIESLGLFPSDDLEVEINLDGPLLNMVAAATKKDDPGFSAVIADLKSIQVQVYPLKGVDSGGIRTKIGRAVHLLEEKGWKSTVRVKDKGEETYIYLKQSGGRIDGLTLLSMSPGEEAVVINIVGRIDPAQLGQLGQNLHVPQLQKVPTQGGARKPE